MTTELETTFTFRNMDSTDALKEHTVEKLEKIEKFLVKQTASAHVIFKVEGPRHEAEITLNIRGKRYVGADISNDMYTSIDGAIHRLEAQMSRTKERITHHRGE